MNTQDGLGLRGYHDSAKSLFSETSRLSKKVDVKNYLIFKYVVENTRLKKSYQIYIGKPSVFFEIEPQEGTSICTESLWSV